MVGSCKRPLVSLIDLCLVQCKDHWRKRPVVYLRCSAAPAQECLEYLVSGLSQLLIEAFLPREKPTFSSIAVQWVALT